jgi:YHS domain-containing protein
MRIILEAVIAVLVITLLRSVLGIILKGFSDLFHPSSDGANPQARPIPSSEALKRDPVCGTFIAPSSSIQSNVDGEAFYFCSTQCRDKFRGAARKAG